MKKLNLHRKVYITQVDKFSVNIERSRIQYIVRYTCMENMLLKVPFINIIIENDVFNDIIANNMIK